METHVMRRMGAAFNPEKHCAYTGLTLWPHPYPDRDGWRVMTWREDGHAISSRSATPQEVAWIVDNPGTFAQRDAQFKAWLESVRK